MDPTLPSCAVLMCHAPIVIPAIGRGEATRCAASTTAMREAAGRIVASGAGTAVVMSPHTPRLRHAFGMASGDRLRGDFLAFGVAGLELSFPADLGLAERLPARAQEEGLALETLALQGLDHGAAVPLWFLKEAGFQGRVAVLGFACGSDGESHRALGRALAAAMADLGRPWALVASGDMSHALLPGAPAGFHPRARAFDDAVREHLAAGRFREISGLDPAWRAQAAEDVVASLEVADGALAGAKEGLELLSYEGPFGVGYLVAVLREGA